MFGSMWIQQDDDSWKLRVPGEKFCRDWPEDDPDFADGDQVVYKDGLAGIVAGGRLTVTETPAMQSFQGAVLNRRVVKVS